MFTRVRSFAVTCVAMLLVVIAGCSSEGGPVGPVAGGDTTVAPPPSQKTVTGLGVSATEATITAGSEKILRSYKTFSDNSVEDITAVTDWSSSNDAVVTVSLGKVTGVAPGTSQVIARFGGYEAVIGVQVMPRTVVYWSDFPISDSAKALVSASLNVNGYIQKWGDGVKIIKVYADPIFYTTAPGYWGQDLEFVNRYWKDSVGVDIIFEPTADSTVAMLRLIDDPTIVSATVCATASRKNSPIGEILSAEVRINLSRPECRWWLQVVHEYGHALGFPHNNGFVGGNDVMSNPGTVNRVDPISKESDRWIYARSVGIRPITKP